MGCSNSKKQQTPSESTEAPEQPPTLLNVKTQEPTADKDDAACKNCANKGRDDNGRRCYKCEAGQKLDGPVVPLKITFLSAQGLRNADWIGKSDPYVICEVPQKPNTKIQTNVIMDNLEPEWNEELEMPEYCEGDSLCFTVKDKDPSKSDDYLGTFTMKPDQFYDDGFDGEVNLTDTGKKAGQSESVLKLKIFRRVVPLKITFVSARALRNADWVGKSDPYVIAEVPTRPGTKIQTRVVEDKLDPEWNEELDMQEYHVGDPLRFTVKDKDLVGSDMLGCVVLMPDQVKDGFDDEVKLEGTGHAGESFLKLKIKIGDEKLQEQAEDTQVEVPPSHPQVELDDKSAPKGGCCLSK